MKKGKKICVEKGCWNPRRPKGRCEPTPLLCLEHESAALRPYARLPDYVEAEKRHIDAERRDGCYVPSWAISERLAAAQRRDAECLRGLTA